MCDLHFKLEEDRTKTAVVIEDDRYMYFGQTDIRSWFYMCYAMHCIGQTKTWQWYGPIMKARASTGNRRPKSEWVPHLYFSHLTTGYIYLSMCSKLPVFLITSTLSSLIITNNGCCIHRLKATRCSDRPMHSDFKTNYRTDSLTHRCLCSWKKGFVLVSWYGGKRPCCRQPAPHRHFPVSDTS